MQKLGGSRTGLGLAALVASLLCVHCGDDDDDGTPAPMGEGGDEAGGSDSSSKAGAPDVVDGGTGGTGAKGGTDNAGGSGGSDVIAGSGGDGGAAGEPVIMPAGEHYGYVFDTVAMPVTTNEASDIGFDLDGDGDVDNRLGLTMVQLQNQGILINAGLDDAVQKGELLLLGDLQTTAFTAAPAAGFATFFGDNPMPAACAAVNDCGHHLDGSGSFDIAADNLDGKAAAGTIAAGVFSGKGGDLPMRLALSGQQIDFVIHGAHVELTDVSADGFVTGRIGGTIAGADVDAEFYPAIHASLSAIVAEDCTGANPPACGCTAQSAGATYIGLLDANDDCEITLDEVKGSGTVTALFESDVDTDDDGEPDSLSCGIAISGKKASFDLP